MAYSFSYNNSRRAEFIVARNALRASVIQRTSTARFAERLRVKLILQRLITLNLLTADNYNSLKIPGFIISQRPPVWKHGSSEPHRKFRSLPEDLGVPVAAMLFRSFVTVRDLWSRNGLLDCLYIVPVGSFLITLHFSMTITLATLVARRRIYLATPYV